MPKGDLFPTPDTLNSIMEFDRVIQVFDDGTATVRDDLYAPELSDNELSQAHGGEWSLMGGYSGQDRYSGPIMHNSEFIGGGMARDILERPGLYVALVSHYRDCPECEDITDEDYICDSDHDEGWAVARMDA